MPIEHWKGGTTITGDSIEYLRLISLLSAVRLERAGIRVRRGRVVWKQVKKEFDIKGGKREVEEYLAKKVEELAPQQEHVVDGKRFVGGEEVQ